jgi:PKD repeat protein
MQRAFLSLVVLAALVGAGCTTPTPQTVDPTSVDGDDLGSDLGNATRPANNTTLALKPPVARMQVFGTDNALVFESDFVAENKSAANTVRGGAPVTFLASPSEAVEKAAKVEKWDWEFGDGSRASGRGVSHAFADTGGVFKVTLTVTDSNHLTDVLAVTLGVLPTKMFNETFSFDGAGTTGALGTDAGDAPVDFPLVLMGQMGGFPVAIDALTINITPSDPSSDFDVALIDADGNVTADTASSRTTLIGLEGEPGLPEPGAAHSLQLIDLAPGAYTLRVTYYFGPGSPFTVSGEVLYRVVNPQVEALSSGGH